MKAPWCPASAGPQVNYIYAHSQYNGSGASAGLPDAARATGSTRCRADPVDRTDRMQANINTKNQGLHGAMTMPYKVGMRRSSPT
jgi:hypothetical protein